MRAFFDIDSQLDFMKSDGALYVPGAEEKIAKVRELTELATKYGIQILGSVDEHYGDEAHKDVEGELKRWGGPFPDHCMKDSEGAKKINADLLVDSQYVDNPNDLLLVDNPCVNDLSHKYVAKHEVSIKTMDKPTFFRKQTYDMFSNPYVANTIRSLGVTEAIVYGVATDYCVLAAVRGLRKMAITTLIVADAIAAVTPETGEEAAKKMLRMGTQFISSMAIVDAMAAIYD